MRSAAVRDRWNESNPAISSRPDDGIRGLYWVDAAVCRSSMTDWSEWLLIPTTATAGRSQCWARGFRWSTELPERLQDAHVVGHLHLASLSGQLHGGQRVHRHAGGADRVSLRLQAARHVDRQSAGRIDGA